MVCELTLAEAAADSTTLDYNWMVALSLINSNAPSRTLLYHIMMIGRFTQEQSTS